MAGTFNPTTLPEPPIMSNPPPQVFGHFAHDGSSSAQPYFDPGDSFRWDDNADPNDPKRRRIARACDMCRRKKIKCDGKLPACTHCQNYKTECVFTHIEKKRNPPKGAKYIEGLENRLGRMEHLLRLSGLLGDDDEGGETDLGTLEQRLAQAAGERGNAGGSPAARMSGSMSTVFQNRDGTSQDASANATPKHSQVASPVDAAPSPVTSQDGSSKKDAKTSEVEALQEMMDSLVTNSHGETRFIGSSSGFSIFSPKGIEWVQEKSGGDDSFQKLIQRMAQEDNKWFHWKPEIFGDIFARRTYMPLPPREECMSLLTLYFDTFNRVFPLYHHDTFFYLADKQYTDDPYEGSGWWASLNVCLAVAYRMRELRNMERLEMEAKGWQYFKNALAVQPELELRNTDLFSIQALLGMALYLTGTPNPQPSFILVASAIRLSHSVGLHKKSSGYGLNATELEQRKRVFWIGYMMDKDISLRSGRPPCINDDDWNVDLPSEDPEDHLGDVPLADGSSKVNLFRKLCEFAIIQGKVYNQLYSVKASKQTDGELLNTIGELDADLERWKDEIPIDFRPEHEIKACSENLVIQIVVLHFSYYNCVTTVHRMSIHHGYWSSRLSNYAIQGLNSRPLNPRVFSSAALCVQAARASINLIRYIPAGDYAIVWLVIYYPVSSLLALFANILQNPLDARARSDLKLVGVVVEFLAQVHSEDSTGSIGRMYAISEEFRRIAGVVLDKAERELNTRQKRKQERERERAERMQRKQRQPYEPETKTAAEVRLRAPASASSLGQARGLEVGTPLASTSPLASTTPVRPTFGEDVGQPPSLFDMSPMNSQPQQAQLAAAQQQQRSQPQPQTQPQQSQQFNSQQMQMQWSYPDQTNFSSDPNNTMSPDSADFNFGMPGMDGGMGSPGGPFNPFQQPFVPQDLWNMPMTFEWDWASMGVLPPDDVSRQTQQPPQPGPQ